MNIWARMVAALRGEDDSTDSMVDAQALRILDKEVRAAAIDLTASKDNLAELIANQKQAERVLGETKTEIKAHEAYALKALGKNDESLAMEVAEKIVELENHVEHQQDIIQGFQHSIKELQTLVHHAEQNLKRLKQQVDTIKATESVQRAQATIAERHRGGGRHLQTAQVSLARLKERQAEKAALFEAEQASTDTASKDALLEKLADAGITSGSIQANDVLARLKKKSN